MSNEEIRQKSHALPPVSGHYQDIGLKVMTRLAAYHYEPGEPYLLVRPNVVSKNESLGPYTCYSVELKERNEGDLADFFGTLLKATFKSRTVLIGPVSGGSQFHAIFTQEGEYINPKAGEATYRDLDVEDEDQWAVELAARDMVAFYMHGLFPGETNN